MTKKKTAVDGLREICEWERRAVMEAIRDAAGNMLAGSVGRAMERYGRACARLAPFETPRLSSVENKTSPHELKDPTETPEFLIKELAKILYPDGAVIEGQYVAIEDRTVQDGGEPDEFPHSSTDP